MKINGIDIAETFGAEVKQWRFELDTRDLKNDSEWEVGSPLPIFQPVSATFKDFTATLLVYGTSRDDILQKASDIIAMLTDAADIEMTGWEHRYRGILEKASMKEVTTTSRDRFQELSLQFTGYEYGDEVIVSESGDTITINNPGNMVSPAIIELTPTIGMSSFTINGLCRDYQSGDNLEVTVNSVTTGKTVILDGESGMITEDGEFKAGDIDMWELPSLVPGENTITLSTRYMETTLRVIPIYM